MADRSSRPHHSPVRTPERTERRIIKVRVTHRLGPARIAARLGLPASTVHRVLQRYGCPHWPAWTGPPARPVRRYEHPAPATWSTWTSRNSATSPTAAATASTLGRACTLAAHLQPSPRPHRTRRPPTRQPRHQPVRTEHRSRPWCDPCSWPTHVRPGTRPIWVGRPDGYRGPPVAGDNTGVDEGESTRDTRGLYCSSGGADSASTSRACRMKSDRSASGRMSPST